MNETITISLSTLFWICGGTLTVITLIKAIKSIIPWNKSKERLDSLEEMNKTVCKSLLAIIDHEISGNNIEKMKAIRDELQRVLIER